MCHQTHPKISNSTLFMVHQTHPFATYYISPFMVHLIYHIIFPCTIIPNSQKSFNQIYVLVFYILIIICFLSTKHRLTACPQLKGAQLNCARRVKINTKMYIQCHYRVFRESKKRFLPFSTIQDSTKFLPKTVYNRISYFKA